jgi:hypothetical protein
MSSAQLSPSLFTFIAVTLRQFNFANGSVAKTEESDATLLRI